MFRIILNGLNRRFPDKNSVELPVVRCSLSPWLSEMEKKIIPQKKNKHCHEFDLIGEIWDDRPPATQKPVVFIHDVEFAGKTGAEKLKQVRNEMVKKV